MVKSSTRNFYFQKAETVNQKRHFFDIMFPLVYFFANLMIVQVSIQVHLAKLIQKFVDTKLFHEDISQYNSSENFNDYQSNHDGI